MAGALRPVRVMATATIEIRNTFHNTSVRVRVPVGGGNLSAHQMRRVNRALCGMSDCRCWHYEAEPGWKVTDGYDREEDRDTWAVKPVPA